MGQLGLTGWSRSWLLLSTETCGYVTCTLHRRLTHSTTCTAVSVSVFMGQLGWIVGVRASFSWALRCAPSAIPSAKTCPVSPRRAHYVLCDIVGILCAWLHAHALNAWSPARVASWAVSITCARTFVSARMPVHVLEHSKHKLKTNTTTYKQQTMIKHNKHTCTWAFCSASVGLALPEAARLPLLSGSCQLWGSWTRGWHHSYHMLFQLHRMLYYPL